MRLRITIPPLGHTGRPGARWAARPLRAAALLVLAVCAAVLAGGSNRVACSACHRGLAEAVVASNAHTRVSCYGCHLTHGPVDWPAFKAREVFVMYPRALTGAGLHGHSASVGSTPCLRCHPAVLIEPTEANGIRLDHRSCARGRACGDCHGSAVHGTALRWARQPVMEECVACHRASDASTACDACHAKESERTRLARGPWQVTHGANWSSTHGMGTMEWCSTCHRSGYCARCHGVDLPHPADFGRMHGLLAKAKDAKCLDCHDEALCTGCHGLTMPHPEGFLVRHSTEASSATDPACLSCHLQKDCEACHTMHIHPGSTDGTARLPRPGEIGLEGTQ